jgi:polysaccharide pyruvyl transferase WcaK-like protein
MKKLLYIIRSFQASNNGDVLINDQLITKLAKHIDIDLVYAEDSFTIVRQMNCLTIPNVTLTKSDKFFFKKVIYDILKNDVQYSYFCMIPGGYGKLRGIRRRLNYIRIISVLLFLQLFGLKCLWICKSIDVLPLPERFLEKMLSNYLHRFSLRDTLSRKSNHLRAEVWPDLAFLLEPVQHLSHQPCKRLIFSFRGDRDHEMLNTISLFCVKLINSHSGCFDEIVCLTNVAQDLDFMNQLAEDLCAGATIPVKSVKAEFYSQVFHLYNEQSVVITNRLHVALPAMVNGAIAFPLIDDQLDSKICGIYRDMKWNSLLISYSHDLNDIDRLVEVVSNTSICNTEISRSIDDARTKLNSKLDEIFA